MQSKILLKKWELCLSDKIPKAKSISVDIGIPAPDWVKVPKLNTKYNPAGISIPPIAAKMGNAALFKSDNSPR